MAARSALAIVPMDKVFSSWKEIAAYLGKGVRTVQRWESSLKLPVHRPSGKGIVLAYRSELDVWAGHTADGSVPQRPAVAPARAAGSDVRRRAFALRVIAGKHIEALRATAEQSRAISGRIGQFRLRYQKPFPSSRMSKLPHE